MEFVSESLSPPSSINLLIMIKTSFARFISKQLKQKLIIYEKVKVIIVVKIRSTFSNLNLN